MPHGHCYLWRPDLVWLHVVSDAFIALAYASIPITLVYIVRKRNDIPFDWIFLCFGLFIILCGLTHVMEIWTVWQPVYWLSGDVKMVTAVVSIITAVLLIKMLPLILALPNPEALRKANENLQHEITERKKMEIELSRQVEEPRKKELEKLAELERFQKMTVGRELKMVELKKENEELKRKLGIA